MAGKKGRSGRKSFYDEKAIAEVVNLSICTIKSFLKCENVSLKDKANVAKDFALKRMPTKIEGEGFETKVFIQNFKSLIEDARNYISDGNKRITESLETKPPVI